MFYRPCFNHFWGLKYIPRLFSEYMLTFRVEEPMEICVTNYGGRWVTQPLSNEIHQ